MFHSLSVQSTDNYRLRNRAVFSNTDTTFGTLSSCPLFPLSVSASNINYIHFYLFHGPPMVANRVLRKEGLTVGNIRCTKYMVD